LNSTVNLLAITAASIGFFHTLLGPDHYVPFIMMSKTGKWSLFKTSWITFLCGIGHIGSTVVLGLVGISIGVAVSKIEAIETFRGGIAAWFLIAFGLVYLVWGLRKAYRNRPHEHTHAHNNEKSHTHIHTHTKVHLHVHKKEKRGNVTPWVLFTVFLFGPCEPLIPILMYPAAKNNLFALAVVTLIFGVVTVGTMLGVVLISSFGISFLPIKKIGRFSHALAGFTILLCGLGIKFLGL
jgi:sulfite exporter TauE/SafE